jgi:hypothetical protein
MLRLEFAFISYCVTIMISCMYEGSGCVEEAKDDQEEETKEISE